MRGTSRREGLVRLGRAGEVWVVGGIETNIPLHQALISEPDFVNGAYHIHWLEEFLERGWS